MKSDGSIFHLKCMESIELIFSTGHLSVGLLIDVGDGICGPKEWVVTVFVSNIQGHKTSWRHVSEFLPFPNMQSKIPILGGYILQDDRDLPMLEN